MIRLEAVTKRYPNGFVAVDALTLEVPEGEICVLVGPSGCGKTTTLKMVNRLVEPTSGRILLDGDDVTDADPVALRRRIGYVIQQVGLFPHQDIAANVATVPKLLGWKKDRVARRVDDLLELVGLDPATYRDRYPAQLSGGQRQRVGVARALAADPPVLLMDEPFGAIDPVTRARLQDEFLRLQQEVRKTIVFVTHDIEEAVKMGDRIAILAVGGVLEQYDVPAEVLGRPASPMVADFVGSDRGLKRLGVTAIDPDALDHPPTVAPDAGAAAVEAALGRAADAIVLVVDGDGTLVGRIDPDAPRGGPAAERVRPVGAAVGAHGSLADALAALLLSGDGWVAVHDGPSHLGILTPDTVYRAARESLGTGPRGPAGPADVEESAPAV